MMQKNRKLETNDARIWKTILYTPSRITDLPQKPVPSVNKWDYYRKLSKNLSASARMKLEWIIFYHTVGKKNVSFTASHFGITRKTLHKWLKRFDEKHLGSLEEQSRKPVTTRQWQVTASEEAAIIALRKNNMELGKKKLAWLYKKNHNQQISSWKVERVIRRHKLYPDLRKQKLSQARKKGGLGKVRIHQLKEKIENTKQFGFLWHIDAIIIWWYGNRRIIFTALEDVTRIAFARVYTQNTSGYAEDFLKRLMYLVEGKIDIMHSDNGSEFAGAFEKACQRLAIQQVYSRPHTPKDNPKLERFNGTVQREWLDFSLVGLDTILDANKDLTDWLVKYNSVRPHAALNYQTPLEFAEQHFFQVSPMWPASTYSCHLTPICYNPTTPNLSL
jgi:transposase InsO family protein/transposase-like protein